MSMMNIACRSLFSCQRSRIPLCILNSYKWRNYATNDDVINEDQPDEERLVKRKEDEKASESQLAKVLSLDHVPRRVLSKKKKKTPFVDLSKSTGITAEHIKKETRNSLLLRECLEESPDKEGFSTAVDIYISKNKVRRGHMDFIATAMKFIEAYELQKESEVYDKLMDVFPRDKFVNRSLLDAAWPKHHPQIWLALDLLTKMEDHGISPSQEMFDTCYEIFGRASFPIKKIERMWFWFAEFYDLNPYKVDEKVYLDRLDVIRAAIDRILGNNDGTKILEISPPIEDDDTGYIDYDRLIVSSQTELQKKYITFCNSSNSIYIEGPSFIWINHVMEEYFIMKTGQEELKSTEEITIAPDEEREGVIIGVCFVTKPYSETLPRWLTYMQDVNPVLQEVNVVFDTSDETSEDVQQVIPSE